MREPVERRDGRMEERVRTTEVIHMATSSVVNCVLPSHPGSRCLSIHFPYPAIVARVRC